jgi:hypothetical protein
MDISQDMMIDILLNLAGYLTAGLLGMVLYSAFRRTPTTSTSAIKASPIPKPVKVDNGRDLEYVSFKSGRLAGSTGSRMGSVAPGQLTTQQRNRVEVIRLAREMLKSGTSKDRVQDLLPISDGEMALLSEN